MVNSQSGSHDMSQRGRHRREKSPDGLAFGRYRRNCVWSRPDCERKTAGAEIPRRHRSGFDHRALAGAHSPAVQVPSLRSRPSRTTPASFAPNSASNCNWAGHSFRPSFAAGRVVCVSTHDAHDGARGHGTRCGRWLLVLRFRVLTGGPFGARQRGKMTISQFEKIPIVVSAFGA